MKTDFLASGNHFLPFHLLPVETVYSPTKTYFSATPSFWLVKKSFFVHWKQHFFIPSFFLAVKTIIEI